MNCPYFPSKVHFQASPYNFTALRKNFKIGFECIGQSYQRPPSPPTT